MSYGFINGAVDVTNQAQSQDNLGIIQSPLVLIGTQRASNSADIVFTTLSNTYNQYFISIDSLQPSGSGGQLCMEISTDGGSTWINSNYSSGINQWNFNTGTFDNISVASVFYITFNTNAGAEAGCAQIWLNNFTSGTGSPSINGTSACNNGSFLGQCLVYGAYEGTAVVNAIRFLYAGSFNITTGNFSLYGLIQ